MGSSATAEHILIIDDDERLANLIRDYLAGNGYRVSVEHDGACGVDRILQEKPQLVILDVMLPGEDGISICRRVRAQYAGVILMMTARAEDKGQVLGLEMGADDYLGKPVAPRVLLARLHALLRGVSRVDRISTLSRVKRLTFDNLVVDSVVREAWLAGERIDLTHIEFDLLWLLAINAGRILSRDDIFERLHGGDYDGQDRSIDVCISRIRAKIGDTADHPHRIKTVRSKGYIMIDHHAGRLLGQPSHKASSR